MLYANPLRRSFDATLLILFILLIRKLFGKKLNPACLRLLWGFVALRILIPIHFSAFDSLYTRLHLPGGCERIEKAISHYTFDCLLQIDHANAAGNAISIWLQAKTAIFSFLDHYFFMHSLENLLIAIGHIGALICTAFFIVQNILFYSHMRRHSSIYGIKSLLPVYIIDNHGGSCLTGIANPQIYVSQSALANVKWCQWIVKHELGHYQSKDNWYNLVSNICLVMQWFNPLIWYAVHTALEDCEIACDYRILNGASRQECIEYGKCLIGMSTGGYSKTLHPAAAVSHLDRTFLKHRITRIAQRTDSSAQTTTGSYFFAITVTILFILCIMGG